MWVPRAGQPTRPKHAWETWRDSRNVTQRRGERENEGEESAHTKWNISQSQNVHVHKKYIYNMNIFSLFLCRMPATQNALRRSAHCHVWAQWTREHERATRKCMFSSSFRFKIFKTCVIKIKYTIFNYEMKTLNQPHGEKVRPRFVGRRVRKRKKESDKETKKERMREKRGERDRSEGEMSRVKSTCFKIHLGIRSSIDILRMMKSSSNELCCEAISQ